MVFLKCEMALAHRAINTRNFVILLFLFEKIFFVQKVYYK